MATAKTPEDVITAVKTHHAVAPVGGRTQWTVGGWPDPLAMELDLRGLNRVVDYPAKDLTITVEAGRTVSALQQALAAEGQWLPVDVPRADTATVGGTLAVNASGARRYGHGTLRDYLIGISFVSDEGILVKAGGRVVKNVAGYDLMKLHTGALGTLGIITQATFKVKPKPEADACVCVPVTGADLAKALDALHASRTRPVVVDAVPNPMARQLGLPSVDGGFTLVIGFEEKAATVAWQIETLGQELRAIGTSAVSSPLPLTRYCQASADLQLPTDGQLVWKANVRPSLVAMCMQKCAETSTVAHALNGILWGSLPVTTEEATLSRVKELQSHATEAGGNLVVRVGALAWREKLPLHGRQGPDADLQKHIKRTLDPGNKLNPGRV